MVPEPTVARTSRGFPVARGFDRYGQPWSIQDSSLAVEACIWLGGDGEEGGRAHLTQADVAALIPLLQAFVAGGSIAHQAEARATSGAGEVERLRERVAEVVEDDGGCWHACSGCQESEDGYVSERDYPRSPIFQCQPGSGCRECGGIGVLWEDGAFLASYGDALSASPTEAPGSEGAMRAALEWYAEQVANCRKIGAIGDPARHALDRDGGERARLALNEQGEG